MQRSSIIADIYGYLVCLLAIVIFVHAAAGFINSAFGANGGPGMGRGFHPPMVLMTMRQGPGGDLMWHRGMPGGMQRWRMRTGTAPNLPPGSPTGVQVAGRVQHEHGPSIRGLVLNLILLVIAVLLFGWHWRWLHRTQPA